jgi:hypothetical protein
MANAADARAAGRVNPMTALDPLATSRIPAERRCELPPVSRQLGEADKVTRLQRLNELHRITDLAAPVTGPLPGIQVLSPRPRSLSPRRGRPDDRAAPNPFTSSRSAGRPHGACVPTASVLRRPVAVRASWAITRA